MSNQDRFTDGAEHMTFYPGPATTARYRTRIAGLADVDQRREAHRLLNEGKLVQLEAFLVTSGV